jgi:hypothetical protein
VRVGVGVGLVWPGGAVGRPVRRDFVVVGIGDADVDGVDDVCGGLVARLVLPIGATRRFGPVVGGVDVEDGVTRSVAVVLPVPLCSVEPCAD